MADLSFTRGVMNAGKSALALQTDFNLTQVGRVGALLTQLDRGGSTISSRLGISRPAHAFAPSDDLYAFTAELDPRPDYLVVDEAQFLTRDQVDQLARVVDDLEIDVHTFGISTDFTSKLFPGSARLLEIADHCDEIQLKAFCWCRSPARTNARVVDDVVQTDGEVVRAGDMTGTTRYVLLCRRHYVARQLNLR